MRNIEKKHTPAWNNEQVPAIIDRLWNHRFVVKWESSGIELADMG